MTFDKRRIANRKDIGVLESWRHARLSLEVGEKILVHRTRMGHFQRDLYTVNSIERLVNSRHRTVGNASLNSIFAESLSCS